MKTRLFYFISIISSFAICCDDSPLKKNDPIKLETEEQAKQVFRELLSIWESEVKKLIPSKITAYVNEIIDGDGRVTVVGSVKYSSSGSSYESRISDLNVDFQDYKKGVKFLGSVRFYDVYSYQSSCSSNGCTSVTSLYTSIDGATLTVEFEYQGKKIKDTIKIYASKKNSYASWDVEIKTATSTFDWYGN